MKITCYTTNIALRTNCWVWYMLLFASGLYLTMVGLKSNFLHRTIFRRKSNAMQLNIATAIFPEPATNSILK